MTSGSPDPQRWSDEAYLAFERSSPEKHELIQGELFAMSGASLAHNMTCMNLFVALGSALRGGPCRALPSDMRVHVPGSGAYVYPDATIVCGRPELVDDGALDTLSNPCVVFEVLSRSTAAWDHGGKFRLYETLPSLAHYVLVWTSEPLIEQFVRQADGTWLRRVAGPGQVLTIELEATTVDLVVDLIYENVFDVLPARR